MAVLLWYGMILIILIRRRADHDVLVQADVPAARVFVVPRVVRLRVDPSPVQLDRPVHGRVLRAVVLLPITVVIIVIVMIIVQQRMFDRRVLVARATCLRDRAGKTVVPVAKNIWPLHRLIVVRRGRLLMMALSARRWILRLLAHQVTSIDWRATVLENHFRVLHAYVLVRRGIRLFVRVKREMRLRLRWAPRAVKGRVVSESLVAGKRAVRFDSVGCNRIVKNVDGFFWLQVMVLEVIGDWAVLRLRRC